MCVSGSQGKVGQGIEYSEACCQFFKDWIWIFFFSFIFVSWRLITLQYCSGFCHTLTKCSLDIANQWSKKTHFSDRIPVHRHKDISQIRLK